MSHEHILHDREDGLHHCRICGGAEASMPTSCPGRMMPIFRQDQVQNGHIDYRVKDGLGRWVPFSNTQHPRDRT